METVFLECTAHGGVLPMGVDADIRGSGETIVEHCLKDAMGFGSTGHAVNNPIVCLNTTIDGGLV